MKVYVAEEAGFCFGVKRALELLERLHETGQNIQVYGQLIHNRGVLKNLQDRGIGYIEALADFTPGSTLVIRTHGIPRDTETELKREGIPYLDATCPFVRKIHRVIEDMDRPETQVIIVGDKQHPEVIAARSYASQALVIDSVKEAQALPVRQFHTISVVAQTTLNFDHFKEIVAALLEKAEKIEVFNTICGATRERQDAIKRLAPRVDFVLVIGDKGSSNTRKLFEVAREQNPHTFLIEGRADLDDADFLKRVGRFRSVGITAGASTPPAEVDRVKEFLKKLKIENREKEMKYGRRKRKSQC